MAEIIDLAAERARRAALPAPSPYVAMAKFCMVLGVIGALAWLAAGALSKGGDIGDVVDGR